MDDTIDIGGLRLRPVKDGTLEHDLHYMQLYAKAGLREVEQESGETPEAFSTRVLGRLFAAGVVLEMLGTLLIPEDMDSEKWTPAIAQDTARKLGAMRDPEVKKQIEGFIAHLVLDFFERGLVSFWKSSPSLSEKVSPSPGSRAEELATTDTGTGAG